MTPQSYNVTKLAAATTYYFRMRYANSPPAFSNLSNQANCTTLVWPSNITYNYVGVTVDTNNHWAYDLQLGDWNSSPTGGNLVSKTEANNSEYDAIEASDNSRWATIDPGSGNEPGIWCAMTIAENVSNILRIDLEFEGYSGGGSQQHQMWVFNATSSGWEKWGAAEYIIGDDTLRRSITSGFANYISGGILEWVVSSSATDESMQVDYVKAVVSIPVSDISPPASVNLEASGEALCVYLKWLAPGDDDIVGTAAEYDVRYSTTGVVNGSNWGSATNASGEPTPGSPGTWDDMFITNLSSSYTYYFGLKTRDEVPNWADIFNSPSAKPASYDTRAPYTVSTLVCGNATGRSVVLTWATRADDRATASSGPAYYNDIRYSTAGAINSSNWGNATECSGEPRPAKPLTTDTFTVTGLSSQIQYWFALKLGDEVINWSGVSNSPNKSTEEPWPQTITNLSATAEWDRVKLSWTAPYEDYNASGSGNCTQYDIRYSTSTITESNWVSATQCANESTPGTPGTNETFVTTGLSEKQTYYFAIKARDTVWDNWGNLSNVANVTVQQPQHDVGDWWMWYVYYNDFGEKNISNKCYLIQNVFAVNETVEVKQNESADPFNVPGCARFDWSVDDRQTSNGSWGSARTDITGDAVVPSAESRLYDAEMWSGAWDATVRIRLDFNMGYYNLPYEIPPEDVAVVTCYTYQGNSSAPASDDGYPFTIGETMDQYEYKDRDTELVARAQYNDFDWEAKSFIQNYNVSVQANITACDHDGNSSNAIYSVYKLNGSETGESDKNEYWYSPKVHNIVRKYDKLSYYGLEEYGIAAYEVADFTRSGLSVSAANNPPNEGDTLTVSINVTNDTGEARKFNMLLLITDMNASTAVESEPYYNGKTVFPDMSSDPSSTWPYYPAVKNTSVLQPGASETVTWSNIYTIPSSDPNHWYKVWCSGLTYGPWEAD